MRVYIRQFQCHSELNLEIILGEHYLILGESGKGKSTIFRAITWCLYGEGKDVSPSNNINVQTSVMVELAGLKVYRQHNPCLLQVQIDGKMYEGSPAESIIEARLGNYQIWKCTTYMSHGFENPLVLAKSKDRMVYLDNLSFSQENSILYLQNIDLEISNIKKILEKLDLNIKSRETNLYEYMNRHRLDWKEYLTSDNICLLESNIKESKLSVEQKNTYSLTLRDKIIYRETLLTRISKMQTELDMIPVITPEILKQKEDQYQTYMKKCDILNRLQSFSKGTTNIQYTSEQIENTASLEYKREQMLKLCATLGITYTENSLEYKKEWMAALEWLDYNNQLNKYNTAQSQIQNLESQIISIRKNIDEYESKLNQMECSIDIPDLPPVPILAQTLKAPVYPTLVKLSLPEPPLTIVLTRPSPPMKREIIKPPEPSPIKLTRPNPPIIPDIKRIQEEMQLLLLGKQLLHCPSCAAVLRLNSGILQLDTNSLEWNQERYQELNSIIEKYEKEKRRYENDLVEIAQTEKKFNSDVLAEYWLGVRKLEETEKNKYLEDVRRYELELNKILQEEVKQNGVLKKEYQNLVSNISQREKTENDNLLRQYSEEKNKYDSMLKQELDLYQNRMDVRNLALRQEKERIQQYKIFSDKLQFSKSCLSEVELMISAKKSENIRCPSIKSKPSILIEDPEILRKKISQIDNLEWIPPIVVSSKQMLESNLYHDLEIKLAQVSHVEEISIVELNKLRQQLEKYNLLTSEISILKIEIEKIPSCKEEYNSIMNSISSLNLNIKSMESYLCRAKLCTEAYNIWQIIENLKLEYKKQEEQMYLHQYFKDIMLKIEIQYYQDLITTINKFLDIHTSYLFDIDIRVQLSLTRKLKTGKEKKELHLDITRDGIKVNYVSLSDGERARVNLLLTCALNQLTSNSLLILDETFSSLDAENKQKCMNFISKQLVGTTLLMVNHEANTGDYSYKINV